MAVKVPLVFGKTRDLHPGTRDVQLGARTRKGEHDLRFGKGGNAVYPRRRDAFLLLNIECV